MKKDYSIEDVPFNTFLMPLWVFKEENHAVTVVVPKELSSLGVNLVNSRYRIPLQNTINEMFNYTDSEVIFVSEQDIDLPESQEKDTVSEAPVLDIRHQEANLNPDYTFETFVVGKNNQMAQAASLAVAEEPGKYYNPLFLYGGSGLGKTHLMHSIAHFILDHNENLRVLYVDSEAFTNELIKAIRTGNNSEMIKFRDKYRNIDVLLIDDIQFIIGRESTQEEFFHTFNTMQMAGKQIIMSSDKPPKDLKILEERFISRFSGGLIVDINPPDYETRMAILLKKAERENIEIGDDVIQYIAENIKSNIRELEGAFNKVMASGKFYKREINVELAEYALHDIISQDEGHVVTSGYILDVVSDYYHVSKEDITGTSRRAKVVLPRQVVMYFCKDIINMPLKSIGELLGDRDHSTVINGITKLEREMSEDDNLRNTLDLLRKKITS